MEKIYDLIIVGSGPAGLAAAIYAQRARISTLIIEMNPVSGGQVINTYEVDNYPGLPEINGFDLSMKMREHAERLEAEFVSEEVVEVKLTEKEKVVITNENTYKAKTIMIATGAYWRKLGVVGEEEFSGMGVSYCATCDGAFFRGKTTACVGGGDVAVEDAIFLSRLCKKVYLIHRRDSLRAVKILQDKLFTLDNVEIIWDTVVDKIEGDEKVERLILENRISKERSDLAVDGVFIGIGTIPNSTLVSGQINTDASGYIIATETGETNIPGVFAVGDVRTKALRQIITAASDGANAVYAAERYLNENY